MWRATAVYAAASNLCLLAYLLIPTFLNGAYVMDAQPSPEPLSAGDTLFMILFFGSSAAASARAYWLMRSLGQ